mmetsp:Transcript_52469/g.168250  ORF Transcript_52469/g.168250 Transcript_52469/m.168250 type:complete len:276 (-) Transcript_52469:1999-2826(-)
MARSASSGTSQSLSTPRVATASPSLLALGKGTPAAAAAQPTWRAALRALELEARGPGATRLANLSPCSVSIPQSSEASAWSRAAAAKSAAAAARMSASVSASSGGSHSARRPCKRSSSSPAGAGICGCWHQHAPASAKAPACRIAASLSSNAGTTCSCNNSSALSAVTWRRRTAAKAQAATSRSRGPSSPPKALGSTASKTLSCAASLAGWGTFSRTSPKAVHMAKRTAGSACVAVPPASSLISGSVRAESRTRVPRDSAAFCRTASEGSARHFT